MLVRPPGLARVKRPGVSMLLAAGLALLAGAVASAQQSPEGGGAGVFVAGPIKVAGPAAGAAGTPVAQADPGAAAPEQLAAEPPGLELDAGVYPPVRLGQDLPETQWIVLTPDDAAAVAAANSLDLQVTAANIRDAESQVKSALGLDDFIVRGSASYTRTGPTTGESDTLSQSVSVSRPLYNEKRIRLQQEEAQRSLAVTRLRRGVTELSLDFTAREATFGVLRTKGLLDVAVEQAKALDKHLVDSQNLYEGGEAARFEVVQAQTELRRAQGDVVSARADLERAGALLRRVLTLGEAAPIEVRLGDGYEPPAGSVGELVALALEQRPEVAVDRGAVAVAETSLRIARRTSALTVDLSGSLSKSDSGTGDWRWQVGVSAGKTFSDGRARESDVESATSRLDSARTALRQTEEDVRLEVVNADIDLVEARERLAVAKQGVVEARERLAIAQVRFETQYSPGIEVVDAQSSLTTARTALVNAGFAVQVAAARLRMSVGMGN